MSFRERLRKETRGAHEKLESQKPFSQLKFSGKTALYGRPALLCYYQIFGAMLVDPRSEEGVFKNTFAILRKSFPQQVVEHEPCGTTQKYLALKYLFLGASMGNSIIKKCNPSILLIPGGQYFAQTLDRTIWSDLLEQLESLNSELKDLVVIEANAVFERLIELGRAVSCEKIVEVNSCSSI